MQIRSAAIGLILMAISASLARGQSAPNGFVSRTEVALMYDYVRANATPQPTGQATGFSLNGITAAGAYHYRPHLSAVVEVGGTHDNGVGSSGKSLTELTYLFGASYSAFQSLRIKPFAQVLFGGVHAYGSIYPANAYTTGGADVFAMTAGGGADYPLNQYISLRAQLDYFFTALPNGSTNRQNNLRAGGGIVVHFGAR